MRYHLNLQMINVIGKAFRVRPIFKGENKNLDIPRVGMSKIENEKDQSVMLNSSEFLRYMGLEQQKKHN